jgi:hypothetical protein
MAMMTMDTHRLQATEKGRRFLRFDGCNCWRIRFVALFSGNLR